MTIPAWLYWTLVVMSSINLFISASTPAPLVKRAASVAVAGVFFILLVTTASRP